ncbi:DUF6957 family protein [Pseudomonas viridiflava]|uniref:DUF6957 family protein n=1 Tax=Pseudomonas viridiflava TaxID=33069 RepID=UPI001F12EB69|nr:hypothetical protein [Pseudomonas viridiflava]
MELLPVHQMIALEGQVVTGAGPDSVCALREKSYVSSKPWCAVSTWVLIDIAEEGDAEPLPKPMLSIVMHAHFVHWHTSGRLKAGDTVMTGYATSYREEGIFETPDTVYVLIGNGFRKSADALTVRTAQLRPPGR